MTFRQAGDFLLSTANRTFRLKVGIPTKEKRHKPNLTAKLKKLTITPWENAL